MSLGSSALLNIVALLWGTQLAITKTVVDDCDASAFTFARFGLAAFLAARYTPSLRSVWGKLWSLRGTNDKVYTPVDCKAGEDDLEITDEENVKDIDDEQFVENVRSLANMEDSETVKDIEDAVTVEDLTDVETGSTFLATSTLEDLTVSKKGRDDDIDDDDDGDCDDEFDVCVVDANVDADADAVAAWRWGIELGAWMFLGFAFQTVGLAFTTAQRSGFLLYLNVKFVPFFARIIYGRKISTATWASALAALMGTALLTYDGSSFSLNVGDLWSVAAAATSAMFILRLEPASKAVLDSSALNSAALWVVAIACLIWTVVEKSVLSSPPLPPSSYPELAAAGAAAPGTVLYEVWRTVTLHPISLIYLGGVTTALANYIQTKAQKDVPAERASIIYAMDPVYGAFFASVVLGESLNWYGIAGAGLITLAAATNSLLNLGQIENGSAAEKATG